MPSTTAAGTSIAISTGTPASQDAAGYAALTYVEVGQVEKLGTIGAAFAKVEFQPLKGVKQKHKGAADYGSLQPSMAYDETDAGQALLRTAAADETAKRYAFRVTFPTGAIRYFQGRVFGAPENVDGADSILMSMPTVEISSRVVAISATGAAQPTLTLGGPLTFASGAPSGTLVANIGNVPAGVTPTLMPNDGRLAIAGDATNGWKVVVGLTVANAGTIALAVAAAGANGASATVAVTAATGADEAVISPPVTTQRSTYAFTDVGVIQRKPSGMPGFGPYWGNPPQNFTTGARDVANDPFWGPLGVKWTSYYSTDHDGEGGVWLSLSMNADPKALSAWQTYDQALAAGVFASVATKPSGNPIFKHAAGASTETPQVIKIGNDWAMFYQTYTVNGSVNQCTNRVLSTDGLNWTGTRTAPWLIFNGNDSGQMGDGHTGYARIAPNPFSRATAPFDWIISSLDGGTDKAIYGMWGTNDPINGSATFIQSISPQNGRLGVQAGLYCADLSTLSAARQGLAALGGGMTQSGSGTAVQKGNLFEFLFDPTGTEIIAAPNPVMPMPLNADVSDLAAIPAIITRDTERLVMFQGTRVPTDGSNKVNVTALATSPRRNKQNTWFAPLSPAIPSSFTTRSADFRTAIALPSFITRFNNVASDVVTFEGADAGANGVGTGMSIDMTSGGTTRNEVFYFEEIPSTAEFIDLYVQDWRSRNTGANRRIGFGIRAAASGTAWLDILTNDGLLVRNNGSGTDVFTGVKGSRIGGVDTMVGLDAYPTLSTPSSRPYGRKNIGLRWYRSAGRAFLLGEGRLSFGVETEEIVVPDALKPGGVNYGLPLNVWFGVQSINNVANREQIQQVRARWA